MTTLSTLAGNVSTVDNTQTLTNKDFTAASNTFPATGTQGFVASGAISTGDTVVLNSDGTVSVVAGVDQAVGTAVVFESANSSYISATYDSNTQKVVIAYQDDGNSNYGTAIVGTVSGTSISFGTAVVFESANSTSMSATYDANAQKVVIAYTDEGNSAYGTAIVGTVSGTSISFGTAVVFESAISDYISATYDSNAQKVVIAYRDGGNSNRGTAIVGTVSGTSISFGTAVVFESASSDYISATYDSNAQKVVISYRDVGNSSYGTAIVGTVSGTSISFGTAVVFESATSQYISATYDANAQKVIIAYTDVGNSSYGTAIVGTVSGTSISFGTAVVFESASTTFISATYDANAQKVVISYRDQGNSGYGTAIVGTVSGTSISFGTAVVFESASSYYMSATYDANAQKVVIAYRDDGNSSYGTSVVFQNEGTNAPDFVGLSTQTVTDTDPVDVTIIGGTNEDITGLTAASLYYVADNGDLTTIVTDTYAGRALASTKLLVRG